MSEHRLNILATEKADRKPSSKSLHLQRREEAFAKFEKMWQQDPEQFNPSRNVMERERITRTWNLILDFFDPVNKLAADLGCGYGVLTQRLCQQCAHVDAVDVAATPLARLEAAETQNLTLIQDYLPRTRLEDDTYDLAISTDVIAFLNPDDYRLFFSELSRVIKRTGYVVCSTPLDINSEDALQRFANLAETEFQIEKWKFSYHYLHIRLLNLISAPSRFALAGRDSENRQSELHKRKGFSRWWFNLNSKPGIAAIWSCVSYVLKPLVAFIEQNQFVLNHLENMTRFLWSDSGISHAIFIGIRRPLVEMPTEETMPQERKQKKEIWE
jgi:2-polyprenyl-3-methyl-5-hydroxy-6-metoxy-1,4-benzoquinol methylase